MHAHARPAGFTRAKVSNLSPFVPPEHGVRGIFEGASFVFFSFIGFDCVSGVQTLALLCVLVCDS